MGSGSHCCSGPLAGGRIHLLRFQKVLWEKEEAEESEGEEGRPAQERKGRRRRGWREGACALTIAAGIQVPSMAALMQRCCLSYRRVR